MGVSYFRGAISGLVALGAIVGSIYLVSVLMAKRDTIGSGKQAAKAAPAATAGEEEEETDGEPAGEAAAPVEPEAQPVAAGRSNKMGARAEEFSPWQFVFMALGAFIAYEFGRGSGPRAAHPVPEAAGEPVYTDPSN
jgi:hypothetical protein